MPRKGKQHDITDEFRAAVEGELKNRNWSRTDLARELGVSKGTVTQFFGAAKSTTLIPQIRQLFGWKMPALPFVPPSSDDELLKHLLSQIDGGAMMTELKVGLMRLGPDGRRRLIEALRQRADNMRAHAFVARLQAQVSYARYNVTRATCEVKVAALEHVLAMYGEPPDGEQTWPPSIDGTVPLELLPSLPPPDPSQREERATDWLKQESHDLASLENAINGTTIKMPERDSGKLNK